MEALEILVALAIMLGLAFVAVKLLQRAFKLITVYEYEKGLQYVRGRFAGVLEAGQYWCAVWRTQIVKMDMRPRFVTVSGQELLSADGVTLRLSLAARYQVIDPYTAVNKVDNCMAALYTILQLALREIIGGAAIDELLERRDAFGDMVMEATAAEVETLGLKLLSVNIKDIMFPGELKKVFSQVVKARQEGLAALERARGETAALRNLANAAKMLENHPQLLQLRLVQAVGESSGSTVVLGMPSQTVPLTLKTKEINDRTAGSTRPPDPGKDTS